MSAPERIWALCDRRHYWQDGPPSDGQAAWHWTEYRRADLPPTDVEVMNHPKVKALVEALQIYAGFCDTDYELCGYEGDLCCKTARAALAAIQEDKP